MTMEMQAAPLGEQPLTDVLERVAARTPGPGAGSAAAVACSLAAGLVEMTARYDDSLLAQARLARASALRERALEIVDHEVTAYQPVLEALAMDADHPQREIRLAAAKAQAASGPLAIAGIAAQLGGLAAESAVSGSDEMVAEAVVAAELADGACRAAAHMVRINLQDSPGDPRRTEVTGLVVAASEALEEAFARAAELAAAAQPQ